MSASLLRRATVVGVAAVLLALGGSIALAAVPNGNGSVYVCYSKSTGAMRVVDYPTWRCKSSERMTSLASATVGARHVSANFVGDAGGGTNMFYLDVTAAPNGSLRSGVYTQTAMTGTESWVGTRTQGTVDTLRFFTAASGAPAAEVTGWECLLAKGATNPDPLGTCGHYRVIVTDGGSLGPDTFCGGKADATDPANAEYCPWKFTVTKGDIRIWTGS